MDIEKIINKVRKKKYLPVSKEEVNELLVVSKLIIEENTYISDKIRLLELQSYLLLQEKTTNDEFLIRIVKTKTEGEDLIKERLEIYNRMWDGCGCKIDYYK
jgi:signal transduction histidine kinase